MSVSGGQVAAGLLLVIAGLWLVLQAVAGGLAGRLLNLGGGSEVSSGTGANKVTVPSPTDNGGYAQKGKGPKMPVSY